MKLRKMLGIWDRKIYVLWEIYGIFEKKKQKIQFSISTLTNKKTISSFAYSMALNSGIFFYKSKYLDLFYPKEMLFYFYSSIFLLYFQLTSLPLVNALSCYACQFSYTNSLEPYRISEDGWCANDTLTVISQNEVIRPCAPWEKYCSTTILTILNSFVSISRQCAELCSRNCESTGYGQDQVSCTDCCEEDNCNNNFTLEYYVAVMGRQYTSWSKPVKNEARFNEKKGLKFPY